MEAPDRRCLLCDESDGPLVSSCQACRQQDVHQACLQHLCRQGERCGHCRLQFGFMPMVPEVISAMRMPLWERPLATRHQQWVSQLREGESERRRPEAKRKRESQSQSGSGGV